jgi:outer membrane protein TolC
MRHLRRTLLLIGCLACGLGGCAVNQTRERASYRALLDLPAAAYVENTTLTLRQALLLANEHNENLSIQGEDFLRTLIQRRRTVAQFLPTLSADSSYLRRASAKKTSGTSSGGSSASSDSGSSSGSGTGSSSSSSSDDSLDANGTLSWNIFNGFRDWHAYWRDTFLIEQRRNTLLAYQEGLLLDVGTVYIQIEQAEASVRVLENSLQVQQERLRDTSSRLAVGFARLLDVAQSESQVAATETILVNARRNVTNAREMLALLTGQPVQQAQVGDGYTLPTTVTQVRAYLAEARKERHELQAAEAAMEAARRAVKIAVGQYYPTLTLPAVRDWQALLSAELPLYTGGRIEADVRENWSFLREAMLVRDYLQRQVEQEIQTAYTDSMASQARLHQLRVQLAAAEQTFSQALASYSVGLATNLDRITAQDTLLAAQLLCANEEFDQKLFYLNLLRTSGLLREEFAVEAATHEQDAAARHQTTSAVGASEAEAR